MNTELIAVGISMFALGFSLGAFMCMIEIRRLNRMIDFWREHAHVTQSRWEYKKDR